MDFDDYLKQVWYSKIENKFYRIPTYKIKIHLKDLKYSIEKPVRSYANLIAIIAIIVSVLGFFFTILINIYSAKRFFIDGRFNLAIDSIFLYIPFFIFFLYAFIKRKYEEKSKKHKYNVRWCVFYEYILAKRGENKKQMQKMARLNYKFKKKNY